LQQSARRTRARAFEIGNEFQEVVMRIRFIFLAVVALASAALFATEKMSKIAPSRAYDKMKTLVGAWDGTVNEGGKELKTSARFKVISDNSVLAHWLDEGTPHEMLTMFHM